MPCGGIYPCAAPTKESGNECMVCGKHGCRHFCEEWDAYVHARCTAAQLMVEDSDMNCVVNHRHTVQLDFSLEATDV